MRKPFRFKQFEIFQDKTAMKVGTDGVLLGAWANPENANKILDIGTGTGLISLMLAQRNNQAEVFALEIEKNAFEQAKENFENSIWEKRIVIENCSLQEFQTEEKFDLIVSNPPFYTTTFKNEDEKRALARHSESLPYEKLLEKTSELLSTEGKCSFIIPFTEEENFIQIAKDFKLYPERITRVRGRKEAPLKRSLLEFSFKQKEVKISELIIEIERHHYTEEYVKIVKDFYLKM
ncbi:tRNA1(Val) (adenine(37)-N6)-methyltransferase [Aureivirga sp. CE67]|uniref:tRNA1(Val) (adenine(37)-N6)-methyltransferase n=1 Tax=Aureivirga sp. CE67 TaxID=1788983 RepID=UPI0018CA4B56|nr:methyltransferase [Aureivirga sp. CE67]